MRNRKEKNIRFKVIMIILLGVLTLLQFLIQRNIKNEVKDFPAKIEIIFDRKDEVYQKIITSRDIIEEKYILSEIHEQEVSFGDGNINIIGIDENYLQINNMEVLSGEWITEENQIVVSEEFAKKRNEPLRLGNKIDIHNKNYTIIGIYENEKHLKTKIENLYVKKYNVMKNLENNSEISYSLNFRPKDESRDTFIKEKLFEDIKVISKEDQEKVKIVDFTESKKNLSKYYYGFILMFEILVLILLTVYLIKSVQLNIKRYKAGTKRKYGKEFLSENMTRVLLQMLKYIILIFFWIFLLKLILEFKLSTPSRVLPPKDIFDFKFYSQTKNIFNEEYSKTAAGYGKKYIDLMRITKKYFIQSIVLLVTLLVVLISYIRDKFAIADKELDKIKTERSECYGEGSI